MAERTGHSRHRCSWPPPAPRRWRRQTRESRPCSPALLGSAAVGIPASAQRRSSIRAAPPSAGLESAPPHGTVFMPLGRASAANHNPRQRRPRQSRPACSRRRRLRALPLSPHAQLPRLPPFPACSVFPWQNSRPGPQGELPAPFPGPGSTCRGCGGGGTAPPVPKKRRGSDASGERGSGAGLRGRAGTERANLGGTAPGLKGRL